MSNLLVETNEILEENGRTLHDVLWWGCKDFRLPLDKLSELLDTDYHSGYGAAEIADDLIIVGTNWWLERHEYDGSEWWEFKKRPTVPTKTEKDIETINCHDIDAIGWRDLKNFIGKKKGENDE